MLFPTRRAFYDRLLTRLTLRCADGFIVQAPREAERLKSMLPAAVIQQCPHPNTPCSTTSVSQNQTRRRLGLSETNPIILFFGIVRSYKGLSQLINALAQPGMSGDTHLMIAGEFWESRQTYESQIAILGLQNRVHIIDRYIPNEEVPIYLSAADVWPRPIFKVHRAARLLGARIWASCSSQPVDRR